jgi:hypothetical protein
MKRRQIEESATNLLLACATTQNSHTLTFHGKPKKFKHKWKQKLKGNLKNERACCRCEKTGHFKENNLKNNSGKK